MSWVFINFRRQDEPGFAALLQRELGRRFGAGSVFYANTTIRPGEDYERALVTGARDASVLLAVIGSRWLTAPHPSGGYAINRRADWVRREIAEAFTHGTQVIPILVDDTDTLTRRALPKDISRLAKCQFLRLRHDNLDADLARIGDEVARYLAPFPGCEGPVAGSSNQPALNDQWRREQFPLRTLATSGDDTFTPEFETPSQQPVGRRTDHAHG